MNFYKPNTIKQGVTITRYLTDQSVPVHGNRAVATWRQGQRDSVSIDDEKGVWNDHVANEGGDVIALCMKIEGLDFLAACRTLGDRYHLTPDKTSKPNTTGGRRAMLLRDGYALKETYTYTDEAGTPKYYVDRYEKYDADGNRINKEFVQRTDEAESIKGVTRLLYNLPNVVNADEVYLVEGERDADTLNALGFVATTNSGGCGFWTADLAAQLKGKNVVIIADNDDSGQVGANKRAASLAHVAASVKVITISALPKGDVSDWLDREGGTPEKLREAVANTEKATPTTFERFGHKVDGDSFNGFDTYGREIDGIDGCGSHFVTVNAGRESIRAAVARNAAEIIKRIIDTRKTSNTKGGVEIPSVKLHEIENVITVLWLRSRGRLFWNAQTEQHDDSLFFDNEPGQLFAIESDIFQSWIANMTNISREGGQQFKTLHALLQDAAVCPDVAAGVIPSKYYDRKGDALYISNGDSYMVRVTAAEIVTLKNGTDDVVFLKGATLPPWELLDGEGEDPFDNALIFKDAWYLTPSGKMLLRLWYLSIFAKHPNRPPLLITAPFKSGKTALFRGINYLLANRDVANAEITDTPQGKIDFWTVIHAGGLYCIDNADTEVSWLKDTLQRVSTGSALPKRKLYKDDVVVCLYPNADIVLTSNNPQFADDCGLSDRFIIVRLEKRGERIAKDGALKADILQRRNAALTWTVRTLQRALATTPDTEKGGRINGRHPDFATFALQCAEAIGRRPEAEAALVQAELDKTLIVLQNAEVARDVFTFLRSVRGKWSGKAADLARKIWPDMPNDPAEIRTMGTEIGKTLKHFEDQFRACFTFRTSKPGGVKTYHFTGMDERLDEALNGQ